MWQSLAEASLKDMGAMGGGAGGGGGGGGGDTAKAVEGIPKNVELWYNWLKKIETTVNSDIVTTPTSIRIATAGNYSGMIGAALLAIDRINTK